MTKDTTNPCHTRSPLSSTFSVSSSLESFHVAILLCEHRLRGKVRHPHPTLLRLLWHTALRENGLASFLAHHVYSWLIDRSEGVRSASSKTEYGGGGGGAVVSPTIFFQFYMNK